eukprot:CAMPEP_0173279250 /NCGR_PEP_ID=MMETSP1143-20121109/5050_1 /TAXON_ID=483371 /ORGANISM="non described non described, Strain CCMP2298" /LENGTH=42 /DNA_ID= /DNA_START= /DNA_END= /DNA_ORIENTATION=
MSRRAASAGCSVANLNPSCVTLRNAAKLSSCTMSGCASSTGE